MECNLTANEPTIHYTPSTLVAGGTRGHHVQQRPRGLWLRECGETDTAGTLGLKAPRSRKGSQAAIDGHDSAGPPPPPMRRIIRARRCRQRAGASCAMTVRGRTRTKSAFEDVSFTPLLDHDDDHDHSGVHRAGRLGHAPGSKGTSGQERPP